MASKENKGGFLTNEEVEKDLEAKGQGTAAPAGGYHGSQDTGDTGKREIGSPVQRQDGAPPSEEEESR
jgi:hypothetical protein